MARYKKNTLAAFSHIFNVQRKPLIDLQKAWRTNSQDHLKNFQDIPSPWTQNLKKWGVAKEFFTELFRPVKMPAMLVQTLPIETWISNKEILVILAIIIQTLQKYYCELMLFKRKQYTHLYAEHQKQWTPAKVLFAPTCGCGIPFFLVLSPASVVRWHWSTCRVMRCVFLSLSFKMCKISEL